MVIHAKPERRERPTGRTGLDGHGGQPAADLLSGMRYAVQIASQRLLANASGSVRLGSTGHGIVKLSERRAEEGDFSESELGRSGRLGDLAPNCKGLLTRSAAKVSSGESGERDVEEVCDLIVNRQKLLRLPG